MINVYSPPERCREELATLLCLTTEALRIGPAQPAMWMGDWNPQIQIQEQPQGSRQTRKLTTTLPMMSTAQGPMRRKADKISDHMIIELPWRTEKKYQDCTVTLEPVPNWHNPGMMLTSEWRMMISNTWTDSPKWPEYTQLMQMIEAPIKTQEEIDEQFTRFASWWTDS